MSIRKPTTRFINVSNFIWTKGTFLWLRRHYLCWKKKNVFHNWNAETRRLFVLLKRTLLSPLFLRPLALLLLTRVKLQNTKLIWFKFSSRKKMLLEMWLSWWDWYSRRWKVSVVLLKRKLKFTLTFGDKLLEIGNSSVKKELKHITSSNWFICFLFLWGKLAFKVLLLLICWLTTRLCYSTLACWSVR